MNFLREVLGFAFYPICPNSVLLLIWQTLTNLTDLSDTCAAQVFSTKIPGDLVDFSVLSVSQGLNRGAGKGCVFLWTF